MSGTTDSSIVPPPPPKAEEESKETVKEEEKVKEPLPPVTIDSVPPPPPPASKTESVVLDVGTLIWVKVEGYPWWPAKVVKESLADEEMLKERIVSDTNLVQFFGDNSIFWVNCGDEGSCKVYEKHMNLMDSYDGEYKEDLKKATTTLKRLFKRKKRKRENDLVLKERRRQAKRRKLDDDSNTGIYNGFPKKKKKKRMRVRKNLKVYEVVGDITETRLREIFEELKKFYDSNSVEDLKKLLEELISHRVSMEQIISTKVGGVVNNLRNHENEEIGELSRRIVYSWKNVVKSFVE